MTRKHFQALADALARACPENYYNPAVEDDAAEIAAWEAWDRAVKEVANVCARSNVNFNRERFTDACQGV